MAKYSCGSFGVRLKGVGGTWRAVEKNDKGFLLWESETHGARAKKVLTDREGNVLVNGVVSFNDHAVMSKIAQYERIRDSIAGARIVEEMALQKKTISKDNSNQGNALNNRGTQDTNVPASSSQGNATAANQQQAVKRPAPKRAAGKNVHSRESVLGKLHEYQTYLSSNKKKAQ